MKNEREMFEEWYKSEYPLDYEHYVNEQDIGLFTKLYLRCFASWKASASREGMLLVPCEPSAKMLETGSDALGGGKMGFATYMDVNNSYKAMIGAAP